MVSLQFLEQISRLALLTRVSEWHDKVLSVVVCSLILLHSHPEPTNHFGLIAAVTLFSMFVGCYGYALNSYCDYEQDGKVGKYHILAKGTETEYRLVIGLSAIGALTVLPFFAGEMQLVIGIATFALATLYSVRPIRFKERGVLGIAVGGITQRPLPFILVPLGMEFDLGAAVLLAAWLTLLGLSTLMAHQLDDFENDRVTRQKTWAQNVGRNKINGVTVIFATACLFLTVLAIPVFGTTTGLVVMLVLFLLSCKQMIWMGEIIIKSARLLRYKEKEFRILSQVPKSIKPTKNPITAGTDFLIERIHAGELASRAPDDCPHKSWEYVGEPYLALNAVIAIGESMGDFEKSALTTRILQLQNNGTWDYTDGQRGPDADTTVSAIRALDRLGHRVDFDELSSFKNREDGLFNTFRIPGENTGLSFLPQSREKHYGVHPCVMPNIWLLLSERGQLAEIDQSQLHRIRRKDGRWPNYFYLSPYYSTRLYTELLAVVDGDLSNFQREAVDFLLQCEPESSPTQIAEIVISFHHLKSVVKDRNPDIDNKVQGLLSVLKNTQRGDGSWAGENIWTFMHRTHPAPVVGFDCFNVHSTSLCVQALKYWD